MQEYIVKNYERINKGKNFERNVAKYYVKKGYFIFHHGEALEKTDNGIDIIAYNQNDVLLIQCKWSLNSNSLGKDVYDKAIKGYQTLKEHIVLKPESAKYKLVLACNSPIEKGKLSSVSGTLYWHWIHSVIDIDREIVFFYEQDNNELEIDRIACSKSNKEQEDKNKETIDEIILFSYNVLEAYEQVLNSLPKDDTTESNKQKELLESNIKNLYEYFSSKNLEFEIEKKEKVSYEEIENRFSSMFERFI